MNFCSLASGSKGNSWLLSNGKKNILIDCGLNMSELENRLNKINLSAAQISALFVTHEHIDHVRGIRALRKKFSQLPVFSSRGTAINFTDLGINYLRDNNEVEIGDFKVRAFTVPHDSKEPLQFAITHGKKQMAILTDIGHHTKKTINHLQNCQALVLEFNYDHKMLKNGDYPLALKKRIMGNYGHLSNEQAEEILIQILSKQNCQLKNVVAAHLSENNNCSKIVEQALDKVSESKSKFEYAISYQHLVSDWLEV